MSQVASLTDVQNRLLWHTLGVTPQMPTPYQNRFIAGPGHSDNAELANLVALGLMEQVKAPAFLRSDDVVFMVTERGKSVALANLPAAPLPEKRSRYQAYLDEEYGDDFASYLGITKPTVEYGHYGEHAGLCRMVRRRYRAYGAIETVEGEWCGTKKAAKASYKLALEDFHARKRAEKKRHLAQCA